MTAFDNIKTNNWPATSNEFEDYLVLELPLNDAASLTESRRDIVVSDKVLHPKVALTNSSVETQRAGVSVTDAGTITGSAWSTNAEFQYAFREGYDTYTQPQTSQSAAFASNGGTYKIVFADGGYSVSQNIVLKFYINGGNIKVNAGETDEQEFTSSDGSGFQTWTIAASSVSQLKNVQLTNSGNTGPYWSGIYVDGVQLTNPPGPKKHYDISAKFDGSTAELVVPADSRFDLSGDFTIEAWTYQDAAVAYGTIMGTGGYYSGSNGGNWVFRRTSATQIAFASYDGQSNEEYVELSATTSLNTWHHIALVRRGTTVQIYVDGVAGGSMTVTKGLEDGANNGFKIGNTGNNTRWNGKFQDIRIYNGVAKYTANFTPPGAILG